VIDGCKAIVVGAVLLCGTASTAQADTVLDWNRILFATLTGQNPFNAARIASTTHVAIFEAVNAITGTRRPYIGSVSGPHGASVDAAAAVAGHDVLVHYFPGAAATLDAALAESLASVPDGNSKTDGITVGHAAAAAVIALRQNDGSAPPQFFFPSSGAAGEWQLTPSCSAAGGILFHWQNLTPFGVKDSSQFRSAPPPALTSLRYRRDFDEVKAVGSASSTTRSDHLTTVVLFYNAALAPAVWNDVARQTAAEQLDTDAPSRSTSSRLTTRPIVREEPTDARSRVSGWPSEGSRRDSRRTSPPCGPAARQLRQRSGSAFPNRCVPRSPPRRPG
jgi:hypothetical protein